MFSTNEIYDNMFDGLYVSDHDGIITYWNQGAEQITGYSSADVLGKKCCDNVLTHINSIGTCLCNGKCPSNDAVAKNKMVEKRVYLKHKSGHRVPVTIRSIPLHDEKNGQTGVAQLFSSKGRSRTYLTQIQQLQRLTLIDALTGLANRRYIESNLEQRCYETKRYEWKTGVIFVDIDDFKKINDTFGHEIGDDVLKMVANTFIENTRSFDLFGRMGGEEFVGLIRNMDEESIRNTAEKLRMLVESTQINSPHGPVRTTISSGVTLIRIDDDARSVLERADRLLYQSKHEGKNKLTFRGIIPVGEPSIF